ncbi:MAG: glycoside hydrolase family 32 protein [Actinomycetia bacterium]|nr:glycoside hydrolase family 32 protein [Actinomycetes bacterium]
MTAPTTSYHLRPASGWLNDPNGMTLVAGTWHVFFQHNPDAPRHAQIAWGHATSTDLASWRLQPVAFGPTPDGPDSFGCWSGVYVAGHDRPAVVYSGVRDPSGQSTICLRWGSPDLLSWGPPVVVAETPEQAVVMRDPYVFTYGGRRLAVLGAEMPDGPAVLLYDRSDELHWRYLGVLVGDDPVLRGAGEADIWECPQLFELDGRWVLVVSVHNRGVLGQVVAAVGDLDADGERLRFRAETAAPVDAGTRLYAPQVTTADGQPLLIGWVRQDQQDPTGRDQAGCLSLPRRLHLAGGELRSRVDPGAAAALTGDAVPAPSGVLDLARRCWSVVAAAPVTLVHPEHGRVEVPPGSEVWVDGDVVELYPPDAVPSTWRHDQPWQLEVPEPGAAAVREVLPRTP